MLLLWRLCLLSSTVVGLRPRRPGMPYLGVWQNDTSGSWNYTENTGGNFTVPDIPNLCGLGPPGDDNVTEMSVTRAFTACFNCTTVSGVVVGMVSPTDLIPTNETASYLDIGSSDTGVNNKRAPLTHMPRPTLMPRAPKAIPLAQPETGEGKQEEFMAVIKNNIVEDNKLDITPHEKQLASWKIPLVIDGKRVETPIGITGIWHEWPEEPRNYKMVGMSGCTGVIIVGNTGFWVGHFWESTSPGNVNGGSSFNYRYGSGKGEVKVRSLEDFKKIATQPLIRPAPSYANSFTSLWDMKNMHGDPFGEDNGGGDIFIITKSAGSSPSQQNRLMYHTQIEALKTALRKYVRPNKLVVRPYIGDVAAFSDTDGYSPEPAKVPIGLNGVSIVLFSPYAGTSENGVPEARAMVWSEVNKEAAIDRKWEVCLGGGNNKRDGAACALPVAMPSSVSPIQSPLPCTPHQDPDENIQGQCACNNGVNIPMVITTDAAGSTKGICPWTTIPPQALTTAMPEPPITNHLQYQYTYTDISKRIIECETYSVGDFDGPITYCAGSTALLYQPPTATVELGSSKVNVGTVMTGKVLFTSISNAVKSLCPTPTSKGAWTSCETGTINVGPASYINNGKPEDGDLTIHVLDAQYNTTDYLDLFTYMLAGAANASASGSNCELIDWAYNTYLDSLGNKRDIDGRDFGENQPIHHTGNDTFCNMNSFFGTQFMDGVQETAKMFFEAEFGFKLADFGNFDCSSTVATVGEVLDYIFAAVLPEFFWLLETGLGLGELACQAAETFHTGKTRREIETYPADVKLARAWEKEMRKERMLPMPEYKKRELGLID